MHRWGRSLSTDEGTPKGTNGSKAEGTCGCTDRGTAGGASGGSGREGEGEGGHSVDVEGDRVGGFWVGVALCFVRHDIENPLSHSL